MTEETLFQEAVAYAFGKMKNLRASHGWDHVQRVLALAERIALAEGADLFTVRLAAVLHDVAREAENERSGAVCHAALGAQMARDFLLGRGVDGETAERVAHCVRAHRFRNGEGPATLEAKVIYDADKLDSIGAIGIGRAFLFSGEVGAVLHNPGADILATSAYSEEDTAYREYMVKLRYVKERMLTEEGRRRAQSRDAFMQEFFDELHGEVAGER